LTGSALTSELLGISTFHSPTAIRYASAMFDTIVSEMTTATGKLAHLRRFL
jgi:hypothetical protein